LEHPNFSNWSALFIMEQFKHARKVRISSGISLPLTLAIAAAFGFGTND
jgi:hypothetical protein